MNYVTLQEASDYFAGRLGSEAWDAASNEDKTKAITMATKAIDRLNFRGEKTDPSQDNEFPRSGDVEILQDIKDACCESALSFLEGVNSSDAIEDIRVIRARFENVSNTFNGDITQAYVVSGIPSAVAWLLLLPYLRDTQRVSIERAT